MDAFWKCLLACVMSLLPTASAVNSDHLISDKELAEQFVAHKEKYQDVVLSLLIDDQAPSHLVQGGVETKLGNLARFDDQMKELHIQSITSTDRAIIIVVDQKGSAVKELVWHPFAFSKLAHVNFHTQTKEATFCRIDDDWAIATVALAIPAH